MLAHRTGDGGKKARSPGRPRRKPLKPFARGMPGCSGEPAVTCLRAFSFARKAAGASSARHSLRPLNFGGAITPERPRASPAAGTRMHASYVIASDSEAIQAFSWAAGLLRRSAPRNDETGKFEKGTYSSGSTFTIEAP